MPFSKGDSNIKKRILILCIQTWDVLSLCSKDNLSLVQISWDVLTNLVNWIWWPPQWKIKLKYVFKSLDFQVAWIIKLTTFRLSLIPSTIPQRSNWLKEHFNFFDQMDFFFVIKFINLICPCYRKKINNHLDMFETLNSIFNKALIPCPSTFLITNVHKL